MFDPQIASILGTINTNLVYKNNVSVMNKDRNYEVFHPSAFGGCLRLMQYQKYAYEGKIGYPAKDLTPELIRIFDSGHYAHDKLSNYFSEIGVLRGYWQCLNKECIHYDDKGARKENSIKYPRIYGKDNKIGVFKPEKCCCGNKDFKYLEISVQDKDLNFYGHVDSILDYTNFNPDELFNEVKTMRLFNEKNLPEHPVIIDYKTCRSTVFRKLDESGPSKKYIVQLIIYANLLDIPYGIILYENKDDSSFAYYKIDKNEELFEEIKKQAKTMLLMAEEKKLPPPRPDKKTSTDCKYCEFSKVCFSSNIWKSDSLEKNRLTFYGKTDAMINGIVEQLRR